MINVSNRTVALGMERKRKKRFKEVNQRDFVTG